MITLFKETRKSYHIASALTIGNLLLVVVQLDSWDFLSEGVIPEPGANLDG
jgi:hypothetical protein